jgi:hypothetical protein
MKLNISELEFDDIKTNLKTFLATKSEFADVNFEGSGINYLLDVLAYCTHYMGYYLNMSVNEMFLDSATLRKNVNLISKQLNYVPRRKAGAEGIITFEIKEEYKPANPTTTLTIPKYTDFTCEGYHFYTKEEYILTNANNYKFTGIVIREGSQLTQSEISTGLANQEYIIESTIIDEDGFEVYVDGTLWTNQNNIVGTTEDTEMYSIEITEDSFVKIIFGDDIVGKIPDLNAAISIIYKETNGVDGNNFQVFVLNDVLLDSEAVTYDQSKVTITLEQQSLGGVDEETIDSIKLNAPKFYEAQNRMVTKADYESILSQHALVEKINVWGGEEDESNPVYGKVWIAIKPPAAYNLTTEQKATLTTFMDSRNILTVNPEFIDISYFHIDVSGTVYYNQLYESQLNVVRDDVETEISDFFDEMTDFDSLFKNAKFTTAINNLTKIENTDLEIAPHFYFSKVGSGNYHWKLDNTIVESSLDCDIITGVLNEGFYDDGNGAILTKKTGNAEIGTIDYETGEIEILPTYEITATEPAAGFRVDFKTPNDDVFYRRNRIIILGTMNITLTRFV